jgi:arylsulfatase A-like enzyme/Tfp pilus assembly protein PilF
VSRSRRFTVHGAAAAALVAALALAGGACRGGDRSALGPFPEAPIVLISIDTLRSDHLPAYGYDRIATPAIDRLRRDGVLYSRAWSSYPLTVPSHVTILSGQLPTEHGVRDNIGYRFDAQAHPYLPRLLREQGFATGGAVSTWLLRGETGLREGFDFYEDGLELKSGGLGESQRSGEVTVDYALEWLRGRRGGKFFLFVHLYEPHTPYDPPEPYRSRAAHPYDGEILHADSLVGRLLDALAAQGDYERSTIVLLSDHGEGLGDHGEAEHGILLYREALQVPLVVKLPGNRRAGTTVDAPAHLADVAPTLAAFAGAPMADRTTLVDLLAGDAPPRDLYAETYYPRIHYGWSELVSLRRDDLHYIEGPDPELYDLAADPGERRNLRDERRRDHAALRQALEPLRRELAAPEEIDREAAQRLASLGYLSARATTSDGPKRDPKAEIHVLAEFDAALRLSKERRFREAVEVYHEVLARQPEMTDAWEGLAHALLMSGREDEALEAYGRAMELTGGADHLALALARVYLSRGATEQATQHAELALATSPAAAHQVLAEVALAQEDFDGGERHARAALEATPTHLPAFLQLAQVAIGRDRLDDARDWLSRAEAVLARRDESEAPRGYYLVKGDLAARLGDEAEAIAHFEREIAANPADPRPYTRLSVVLALGGRPREAVGALRRLVEDNQTPSAYAAAVEALRVLGDRAAAARLLQVARGKYPAHPRLAELETAG